MPPHKSATGSRALRARALVIIEEFRMTLFHDNLPPMRANPAPGGLSREGRRPMAEGRGPICQVEEVEGAIRSDVNDCPAGDLPVDQFAAPFWLLGCRFHNASLQ
jgi:hypothetical protein